MNEIIGKLKLKIIEMSPEEAGSLTKRAIEEGLNPEKILKEGMIPAMDQVGDEYAKGERYVPEMLISAEAMKEGMKLLRPLLAEAGVESTGKVVMGTVEGDLHDIGQNLVSMMLEGSGFEVINLGTEITAEKFVKEVKKNDSDLLGMSALLTTTMTHMPEVVKALEENNLRDKVKIMIGGAPITHSYAEDIGADGYAPDAASAVKLARKLHEKN